MEPALICGGSGKSEGRQDKETIRCRSKQNCVRQSVSANGANGAPCSVLETHGHTRFDFDNLTFEVGRFMMDLGEARLVGEHRWGTLSPAFDGLHFMMGNTDQKWSLRVFGARPVQRDPISLNWNTPETYFSDAYVTNRDLRWVNFDPQWSYMKRVSFDFGYSHLFKGDYFDKVPFSPGMKDTNYGYTMVTSS
ncbi:alginate export family protein [Nitrosomonas oligotropha]|uniref:Alginate export n=1 Tax=Nitrosomonas oligotropha TaxID=42354 RepID=A0A1H8SRZ5_9PROT|nr:alginate export family protein [Nitrosomonas oligotropha]SDX17268.1 Alginate export [Nitrosomonas oligotropha]SEO81421.1 Alginate export [Nitrosomonas oligotropha]